MAERRMKTIGGPKGTAVPGGGKGAANPFPVMKRVLAYMLKSYKFHFTGSRCLHFGGRAGNRAGILFMQVLIDDYILPLVRNRSSTVSGRWRRRCFRLAGTYLLGILCSYGYNRIMVTVSQGTMRNLRVELFTHMESLPIKYFDTHAHGDIMSIYTNDVDTLRQLLSQSIPQVINSAVTIVIAFVSMMTLDVPLTLITLCMVAVMLLVTSAPA